MAEQEQTIFGIPVIEMDSADPEAVIVARALSADERERFKEAWNSLGVTEVQIVRLVNLQSEGEAE